MSECAFPIMAGPGALPLLNFSSSLGPVSLWVKQFLKILFYSPFPWGGWQGPEGERKNVNSVNSALPNREEEVQLYVFINIIRKENCD